MRRILAAVLSGSLTALAIAPVGAAPDKTLQNLRGDVAYQRSAGTSQPVAPNASVPLQDNDSALTGANSLAGIQLPDSSRVLVGSNTHVKLAFFNQTAIAHAQFILYQGKTRFRVEHPGGAQADYAFKTPSADISVRGTVGDVDVEPNVLLQVNVYDLTDPAAPVVVTMADGTVYKLGKGQSLTVYFGHGAPQVQTVSLALVQPFIPDFGGPDNSRDLGLILPQTPPGAPPPGGTVGSSPAGGPVLAPPAGGTVAAPHAGSGGWLGLLLLPIIFLIGGSHGSSGSPFRQPQPIGTSAPITIHAIHVH